MIENIKKGFGLGVGFILANAVLVKVTNWTAKKLKESNEIFDGLKSSKNTTESEES